MLNPSASIILFGFAVTAVLLVADWLIWGLTYAHDRRLPTRMFGLGAQDTVQPANSGGPEPAADSGFRRVA